MKRKLAIATALGAFALAAPQSRAVAMLTLSEAGFPTLTIFDNGVGDLSPAVGNIVFAGTYGTYAFESDTGNTKPAVGSSAAPILGLANTTLTAGPGSTPLTVTFTETGFDPGSYSFASDINGTLAAHTVAFSTYANGTLLSTFTGGPGPFASGIMVNAYSSAAPIALTLQAVIDHPSGGLTLFDANLIGTRRPTVPDGGTTAILLGLGFLGMAGLRTRK